MATQSILVEAGGAGDGGSFLPFSIYVPVYLPAGPRPASNSFLYSLPSLPFSPPANRARRCRAARRPFGSALLMHVVAALDQMESGENLEAVAHTPDVSRAP